MRGPKQKENMKLEILSLITKLSDRDTYPQAASKLTSVAQSLESPQLSTFITALTSVTLTDKPLVRKHALTLLTTLVHNQNYQNAIPHYFPKLLSFLTRLLPDPISRAEAVSLARAVGMRFALFRPVFDCLFTAQDANTQVTAAMCLGAAVESSVMGEEVDKVGRLVGKFEKLVRSDGYKGKAAVLGLIGIVVWVGGVGGRGGGPGGLRSVVRCLVECLKSEDWGVRKGASDALGKVAVKERYSVSEFKGECIRVLENRRFDKVKEVREIMNKTLEAWKQVPDLSDEASPPPGSQGSSREDASDGHYPPSGQASSGTPQVRKRSIVAARSAQVGTTARKRSPLKTSDKNASPTMYNKMEEKNTFRRNTAVSRALSMGFCKDDPMDGDENIPDRRRIARTPISKNFVSKTHKVGSFKSGSRVVPCCEESLESAGVASNAPADLHKSHRDTEELSSIRKHLVQIEEQQSGLMDLLQKFMGSTQNGMRSLEARVHGLELTLDEISYDLAVTSGRMTNTDTSSSRCCMLPGADFLSPKFWRKSYATSRYSISEGTPYVPASRYRAQRDVNIDSSRLQKHRFRPSGGAGFILNPLADMQNETRAIREVPNL